MRNVIRIQPQALLLVLTACLFNACNSGFSNADIQNIENSIKAELSKKSGIEVLDIQMMKEAPNKLTGFAKIKVSLPFGLHKELTKNCSAIKDDGKSMWKCE